MFKIELYIEKTVLDREGKVWKNLQKDSGSIAKQKNRQAF